MLKKIKKALSLDWKQLHSVIAHMSRRSGRGYLDLFRDMLRCYQEEGYTWLNYMTFGFDEIRDPKIRSTYLSEYRDNKKIIETCNPKENIAIFEDKAIFNERFKDFMGRDVLDLRRASYGDFAQFLQRNDVIFCKPPSECGGHSIERYVTSEVAAPEELYRHLMQKNLICLEEGVVQHPKMKELSENSLNTIRIATTISPQGEVNVAYMSLRFSTTDAHIDNASMGGAFTLLTEDGRITRPGYINYPVEMSFTEHPATGESIIGFQVPMLEEIHRFVKEAAMVLPESRYVGWDIGISEKGPVIIEGNSYPSVELYQARIHMDDGLGKAQMMQDLLGLTLR